MFSKVDYIMVNVSDMSRSIAFYRDVLGFRIRFESPGWSEFETGSSTLALHHAPLPAAAGAPQDGPRAGTCSIGFSVKNLEETHAQIRGRGARFVMPPTVRKEEGIRLAVCIDPDGLPVSFAETLERG